MRHGKVGTASVVASIALAWACGDDGSGPQPCDAVAGTGCAAGNVCVAMGPGGGVCVAVCDLATPRCPSGSVCLPAGTGGACVPTCNPADGRACGDGWACAPAGDHGNICRPLCGTGDAGTCPAGEVCRPLDDGRSVCARQCDPVDERSCPGDDSCEVRTDGLRACYDPVRLRGRVFDLSDDSSVEGAHVSAADKTGSAATDIAVTAADGTYALVVPVLRNADGTLAEGIFTLRVVAQDFEPFPHGVRVALPIDAAAVAVRGTGEWIVRNATTDVGLIPLPADRRGLGSIAGAVRVSSGAATPSGVLVVVEGGVAGDPPIAWSDRSGAYRVFNVAPGTYEVRGYKALLQLVPAAVAGLAAGEHRIGVDLLEAAETATATVSGSINIVNPGDCDGTSIVLVPRSTFDDALKRGEVATGMRAPPPGEEPTITGAWEIRGVPDGSYAVLAAFENDFCVRDPDPGIAGTQIVFITVPDPVMGRSITIGTSFKVTGALRIISPGSTQPEEVTGTPTFRWVDDSSEDWYDLIVYDAFGAVVWSDDSVPRVSGGDVSVVYGGPALSPGMYYQFRATSMRARGPISMTEDLLGVFFLP